MRLYSFDDVVGNANIVAILRQSLINGTFPQIAIFSGVFGTGKSTSAEITGLSLTCENPVNGNPCLECSKCKNTLGALTTTGMGNYVSKINVGKKNTKADVDNLIKDIFILKSSEDAVVYIIEEAHALSKMQQTALLEELDKIPKATYVIFCTTKATELIPELRSRAINFQFGRISDTDANALLDKLGQKFAYPLDAETKRILINHSRGVPRQLTNLFDFVAKGHYKNETLASFLGIINEADFINLFYTMVSDDMFIYANTLEQLLKEHPTDVLIEQLKDFVVRVVFLLEGDIKDGFDSREVEQLKHIFRDVDMLRVAGYISAMNNGMSDADTKMILLRVRQMLRNKTIANVVSDKAIDAVYQSQRAKNIAAEQDTIKRTVQNKNQLTELNLAFLNQFGGGSNESKN